MASLIRNKKDVFVPFSVAQVEEIEITGNQLKFQTEEKSCRETLEGYEIK